MRYSHTEMPIDPKPIMNQTNVSDPAPRKSPETPIAIATSPATSVTIQLNRRVLTSPSWWITAEATAWSAGRQPRPSEGCAAGLTPGVERRCWRLAEGNP